MKAIAIILLCVLAAVAYGIVHDQITVRICLKSSTFGHSRAFASESPTLHALLGCGGNVWLIGRLADRVPRAKHTAFLAGLWMPNASHLSGLLGGLVVAWTISRWRASVAQKPTTPS